MNDLWLKHVRQEGMVVSSAALESSPVQQLAEDTEAFASCNNDFWQIADKVLDWPAEFIAPSGNHPDLCTKRLTELNVTLRADAAILDDIGSETIRLYVKNIGNEDPDRRGALPDWDSVSHQQAFDRMLRDTGVAQGVLITDKVIRLVYSPPGETPGFLEWPLFGLATTAGRPMLAGLKLLLGKNAIWGAEDTSLDLILKRSREHQNTVSTKLAEQVLGALYTLMRGFTAGNDEREAMRQLVDRKPQHVYEGLLSVLLRLVFVLYAEDRNLIPSRDDDDARRIYDAGYSVRDLFARLEEDAAQYPDTMDDRYGAWGRLLGLFRLIHQGSGETFMHARRGKLFNPNTFPFLEGRFGEEDPASVISISDGCIQEVLQQLLILNGERLSYKTLDVEQIGSVYETVMGFVVARTKGRAIALKVKPNAGTAAIPAFVELDDLLKKAGKDRKKFLKDTISFDASDAQNKALKTAKDIPELLAAVERSIDERASPNKRPAGPGTIVLQPTDERRQSGSHYTPRSLTGPIVKDALLPILNQLGEDATPDEVLAIKVCDPAMGSGAFLVETCRALGERLEQAWQRHPELMPDDAKHDAHVFARREVAKRCLYGVDRNEMATDLAKLSLWLVTLARDEDFSFLDHALKTGDSLVGLSVDQIKALTWEKADPKKQARFMFAQAFDKAVDKALQQRQEIRRAPDNVTFEIQSSRLRISEKELDNLRRAGNAVIGVFFSEKKPKDREKKLVDLHAALPLGNDAGWAKADEYAHSLKWGEHPIRPFHWSVEFPEVFAGDNPGFHSIVGNPPFAGKNTVARSNRDYYPDWLKVISPGSHGNADLVAHFFRRAYALIRDGGTFGLIATKTIGQGDTRESGLLYLLQDHRSTIYRAKKRTEWPGAAAVVVSTVHIGKGDKEWPKPFLDNQLVSRISAFLREGQVDETPVQLNSNNNLAFNGLYILGMGFTFDDQNAEKGKCEPLSTMRQLVRENPQNKERLRPYLGGEETSNDPKHEPHRYVIDFQDFPLRREQSLKPWREMNSHEKQNCTKTGLVPSDYTDPVAADWPDLLDVVERHVKPERLKNSDELARSKWWQFFRARPELQSALRNHRYAFSQNCGASPHLAFALMDTTYLPANTLAIVVSNEISNFAFLQSRVHEIWGRLFSSSMKDDLRYTATDCLQNFPVPATLNDLSDISEEYISTRGMLMGSRKEGMTKTYNRFHDQLETSADILKLRELHAEMDDAVLRAYGWDDLAALCKPGAEFAPRFLKEDDEPEFAYQGRYFWPAPFRDKVLARLLALNKERAAAEKAPTADIKKTAPVLQVEEKGSLL